MILSAGVIPFDPFSGETYPQKYDSLFGNSLFVLFSQELNLTNVSYVSSSGPT
jgi:hypothetical protein